MYCHQTAILEKDVLSLYLSAMLNLLHQIPTSAYNTDNNDDDDDVIMDERSEVAMYSRIEKAVTGASVFCVARCLGDATTREVAASVLATYCVAFRKLRDIVLNCLVFTLARELGGVR
ncbi:hypothetical protein HK096_004428, partial [Nowakowskiella sp. JEL0078]